MQTVTITGGSAGIGRAVDHQHQGKHRHCGQRRANNAK